MLKRIIGGLAALLLTCTMAAAGGQVIAPPVAASGGTTISPNACPGGQAANGIDGTGTLNGCFTPGAASVPFHAGYKSGVYYMPIGQIAEGVSGNPVVGTAYCAAGGIGGTTAVKLLALLMRTTTAGTTSFTAAVYANGFSTGIARPEGTPVAVTAQTSNTGTAGPTLASLTGGPITVSPGLYWFCLQQGDTTMRFGIKTDSQSQMSIGSLSQTSISSAGPYGVSVPIGTYGTWPTFGNSTSWTEVSNLSPAFRFTVSQ